VTSVVAARRGAADVALGNVLGSNLFNLLGILGATALAHPIAVPEGILRGDVWVMAAATVALVFVAVTGWRITRTEGVALLTAYGGYLTWLVATA
jgi:cation:H+ antiporter